MFSRALMLSVLGMATQGQAAIAFEGFEPERPFTSLTSQILEQGLYQLEQGARYEGGPGASVSFPSLHRLGLGSDLEMVIETPIVTLSNGVTRLADLSIGGKWRFTEGGSFGQPPGMGLQALAAVGEDGRLLPRLTAAVDVGLPGALKLGCNLGTFLASDSAPWAHYSATLAWGLTERLRVCAEVVGEGALTAGDRRLGVDGGLGWLLEPSTQLDMLLYKGMTPQTADWSASIGLSRRWGM